MTSSELRYMIDQANPTGHFFDRETMRFFGDTMKNYGVCETTIDTWSEKNVPVYELYRRKPVKNKLQASSYWRKDTLRQTFKV